MSPAWRSAAVGAIDAITKNAVSAGRIGRSEVNGCHGIDFSRMEAVLPYADLVMNTVPCHVLGEQQLTLLPKDTPVLDLASKPGGDDVAAVYVATVLWCDQCGV